MSDVNAALEDLLSRTQPTQGYDSGEWCGDAPEPLEELLAGGGDWAVEVLRRALVRRDACIALRSHALLALGRIGTREAVAAIGEFEDWAEARGKHVRPCLADALGAPTPIPGPGRRTWAAFCVFDQAWAPRDEWMSRWLTWTEDGETWAPAHELTDSRLDWTSTDEVLRECAQNVKWETWQSDEHLEELTRIRFEEAEAKAKKDYERWHNSSDEAGTPEPEPAPSHGEITQAVFTLMYAVSDRQRPLVLPPPRPGEEGVPLRGYKGLILLSKYGPMGWENLSFGAVEPDGAGAARVEASRWWGPLAGRGYEAVVELKHGRWVTTEFKDTWVS